MLRFCFDQGLRLTGDSSSYYTNILTLQHPQQVKKKQEVMTVLNQLEQGIYIFQKKKKKV